MADGNVNRPKLILHVGPGKTGSSAIQKWLLDHQQSLRQEGLYFPAPENPDSFEGNCNELQLLLRRPARTDGGNYVDELTAWVERAHVDLMDTGCRCLIVSNENLAGASLYQLSFFRRIAQQRFDVDVVMVVREPYGWMWSSWGQGIKRAGLSEAFDSYVRRNLEEYGRAYLPWLDTFDRVRLIAYSRASLIADFARAIGVDPARYGTAGAGARAVNRSLTAQELDLLMAVNDITRCGEVAKAVSDYLIARNPSARSPMVVDARLLEELATATAPVLKRLRALLPGCAPLPAPDAADGALRASPVLVLDRDLLLFILRTVRNEDASEQRLMRLRRMMLNAPAEAPYHNRLPEGFSAVDYLVLNQDVLRGETDPVEHYLNYGQHEGRLYCRRLDDA